MKKGYVSIEAVIVAAIVMAAGLAGIAVFTSKGTNATAKLTNAFNQAGV